MRKWLGIGMLSVLSVTSVGGGAYWNWCLGKRICVALKREAAPEPVSVPSKNDGNAEVSDVIEPLIVQRQNEAPPEGVRAAFAADLERVICEAGTQQPPRPDEEPGSAPPMPYADEDQAAGIGMWLFFDWVALKAQLSKLNLFRQSEKTDPAEESENTQTDPPAEPQQPEPMPDYHQQYPHCPYQGPCPSPYRWLPRD